LVQEAQAQAAAKLFSRPVAANNSSQPAEQESMTRRPGKSN